MQEELPSRAAPAVLEISLRDALKTLHRSPVPTLPILDPETGRVLAILSRPEPPRLGGMATPLGVYLHDGILGGGAGFWGLYLTGVTMSGLLLLAQAGAHGLAHESSARLPRPRPGCRCRLSFCCSAWFRCLGHTQRSIR